MSKRFTLISSCSLAALICVGPSLAQEAKKDEHPQAPPVRSEQRPAKQERPAAQVQQERKVERPQQKAEPRQNAEPQQKRAEERAPKSKRDATADRSEPGKRKTDETQNGRPRGTVSREDGDRRNSNKAETGTSNKKATEGAAKAKPTESPKAAESPKTAEPPKAAAIPAGPPARHADLSEDQRNKLRAAVRQEQTISRISRSVFEPRIGARVPRTVHLERLPVMIVALIPGYRDYNYVLVDDDICIVDPATYEVVVVIPQGPREPVINAGLRLSSADTAFLLSAIAISNARTLGLGALTEGEAVPSNIDVLRFSDVVLERIPQLRDHRFFTAERSIVVVNADSRRIALVVSQPR